MSDDLNPCPMCGGEFEIHTSKIGGTAWGICKKCGLRTPTMNSLWILTKYINTRYESSELPEWLKDKISESISQWKSVPDLDGQVHGNIQALVYVLSLRREQE